MLHMNKIKAFAHSIARSVIIWVVVFMFWALDWIIGRETVSFIEFAKFVLPYYVLWLVILVVSVARRGVPFQVIWMGSLRDENTFSSGNAPYALIFLGGSILILSLQMWL